MNKKDAVTQGDSIVKQLGPGWTAHVAENMGWHASVHSSCGRYSVWQTGGAPESYCCLLGRDGAGEGVWDAGHGKTPQEAVNNAWNNANSAVSRLLSVLGSKPVFAASAIPVCEACGDTHSMLLRDRMVPCTRCPTPCQNCRKDGNGAYCTSPSCYCLCHTKSTTLSSYL